MSEPTGGSTPPQEPSSWHTPPPVAASPQLQSAPVAQGPAPGVAYADTTSRVVAYILDSILFFVVGVLLVSVVLLAIFTGGGLLSLIATILITVVGLLGSAIYFVYTWTTMRASLGQRALGLETVNAADGATLTRDQAIRRWAWLFGPAALGFALSYAPGALGALGSLIGFLAVVYQIYLLYTVTKDPKRQGYHDLQARTVVVKRTR